MVTRHTLNSINWDNYEKDSIYQLVLPQPGMIEPEATKAYVNAESDEQRRELRDGYMEKTNPHDGKQQLNKPWFECDGDIDFLEGSQHKYPQCMLVFDKTTQNCFSFCTYCFRHAQVRGDDLRVVLRHGHGHHLIRASEEGGKSCGYLFGSCVEFGEAEGLAGVGDLQGSEFRVLPGRAAEDITKPLDTFLMRNICQVGVIKHLGQAIWAGVLLVVRCRFRRPKVAPPRHIRQ